MPPWLPRRRPAHPRVCTDSPFCVYDDPKRLYAIRRNRCTVSTVLAVRHQPFCLYDSPPNHCSGSPVLHTWLDLVRPTWYDHLRDARRTRPLRLQDLRRALTTTHRLETDQLQELVATARQVRPIDQRVVATIVGVAGTS